MSMVRARSFLLVLALAGALAAKADPPPPPPGAPPEPPPGTNAPAPSQAPMPGPGQAGPPQGAPPQGASAADAGEDHTPPRLSFTDGEVSFWRTGAEDWTPAQVNMPLGPNDQLYTGDRANLEVQIGPRAFVRAGEDTQLGLSNLEPDFLQFRIVSGHASLDLRSLKAGTTVEVDTPQAAFTVEHPGYYRIEVTDENTSFTSRRSGQATVTPANGQSAPVAPSEQVVVAGDPATLETYAAPELDDWDRWNYSRTDQLIDAVSARYVPYGEYGVDDLDHNGDWRVVPTYGSVWVPRVAPGWAPYTTGSWVYDPYYGWTWVDTAPWGWAPFHYGRWVFVGGYWGWAPGPLVARPYYAPALVAFFNGPSFSVGISFGHANTGWVALGWGEPCVPWWGGAGFRGSPHWIGWGGPRVVNNVVIKRTTIVNVNEVHTWANAGHPGAVVGVPRGEFGHGVVRAQHFDEKAFAKFQPVRGSLEEKPTAASLVPRNDKSALRPSRSAFERTVVATREPHKSPDLGFGRSAPPAREELVKSPTRNAPNLPAQNARTPMQQSQVRVNAPDRKRASETLANRPPFGRGSAERESPPQPPRYRENASAQEPPPHPASQARPEAPDRSTPRAARERGPAAPRELPGEPANRVFRGHGNSEPRPAPAVPRAAEPPHHNGGGGGNGQHGGGHPQRPQPPGH